MKVALLDIKGKDTGRKVSLSDSIYSIDPNHHAIYLDVKHFLANQRQGTHKSKERADIKGSTRKIKKQKGTGTARAGNIKSPLFRGGGRVFGPKPRSYSFKLNKKLKALARKSAFSLKLKEHSILVLERLKFDVPKTSLFIDIIGNLGLSGKKTLLVLGETNKNVYLSSRNLQRNKVIMANELSTYNILNSGALIIEESAVEKIENLFS